MAEATIRRTRAGDEEQLLPMWRALFPDSRPDELGPEIQAYVDGRPKTPMACDVYVYDRGDGHLGGFVEVGLRSVAEGAYDHSPVAYLQAIYVDEDLRRQGVGAKLVAVAELWAGAHGCRDLASDALLDNVDSHQFHVSVGFIEVELAVHYVKRIR